MKLFETQKFFAPKLDTHTFCFSFSVQKKVSTNQSQINTQSVHPLYAQRWYTRSPGQTGLLSFERQSFSIYSKDLSLKRLDAALDLRIQSGSKKRRGEPGRKSENWNKREREREREREIKRDRKYKL